MKGCFKFIVYGIIAFIAIAIIYSLLTPEKESETEKPNLPENQTEEEFVEPKQYNYGQEETDSENEETTEFNLANSPQIIEIKNELTKSYESAMAMRGLTQNALEIEKSKGNANYNKAYQAYLTLQTKLGDKLPRGKSKVISEALKVYAEIFNNKYAIPQDYRAEIKFIQQNLEDFPETKTQIEKDNENDIIRLIIGARSVKEITLPSDGQWCIMELTGDDRVWVEGFVPNNGFAKYDVASDQLPMYLGNEKRFKISSNLQDINLIFSRCERK
ncbi:hypothetical protein [uncultured Maribacter sp.]|uniref:hypothetical protein n=1 Tax=uncultured Maribacter sp. TaxID=431308 RepID=UPI0030DB7BC4|tara:strand:- start:62 stop:880 length:819 start_codon:yes stop_codon:yes gene_type:complete